MNTIGILMALSLIMSICLYEMIRIQRRRCNVLLLHIRKLADLAEQSALFIQRLERRIERLEQK